MGASIDDAGGTSPVPSVSGAIADPGPRRRAGPRAGSGALFAVTSALAFGMSGALARGLLDAGWSAGAAVLVRTSVATLVLLPPAHLALRGRWHLLRRGAPTIIAYGLLAVAVTQLCYFTAVSRIPVGVALLVEYTAPVPVMAWMWVRHRQRPGRLTVAGTVVAALGLVLVLGLATGSSLDPVGVLWAVAAMIGAASYFVLSADERVGLPPLVLAAGGLLVGSFCLAVAGPLRIVPMHASTAPAVYALGAVPWWVPLLALGVVTAALAYSTGIEASRRLGSRLASFFALLEVVAAVGFAYVLLGELPRPTQLLGGVVILVGIVIVRLGEERIARAGGARRADVAATT